MKKGEWLRRNMVAVFLHALSYSLMMYGVLFLRPKISSVEMLSEITLFLVSAFAINFISFSYVKNAQNKLIFYLSSHCAFVVIASVLGVTVSMFEYSTVSILFVVWPFFFVNVIAYLVFTFMKRAKEAAAACVCFLSIVIMWAIVAPHSLTMEKLDNLVEHGAEQRIYAYKNDYYFVGTNRPGVFKLSTDGLVNRIIDSDTRIIDHNTRIQNMDYEDRFCVRENILYFKAGKAWKKLNLDNNEILAVPDGDKEAKCGLLNTPNLSQILGAEPFIKHSQISDDGYIYFSNDAGLHRTRPAGGQPQMLVSEPVTVFSVEEDTVTYYHVDKRKIEKQKVAVSPRKPPSAEKKVVAVPAKNKDSEKAVQLHAEGLELYRRGQFAEAIDKWSQEFAIGRNSANTANNIAIAYDQLRDYDKAIEYTRRSLELDPGFGHAYHTMGTVYLDLKDFEQAKHCFEKAIELKWDIGSSSYNLGQAYLGLKDFKTPKNHSSRRQN